MAENDQTKVCPLCAETIKAAAKVCPYCRKPQGRGFYISEHDAAGVLAILIFAGLCFAAIWFFTTGRQYSPASHKIMVLTSIYGIEKSEYSTNVVASGLVTNGTDFSWDSVRLEFRFLDPNGKTIEVAHGSVEDLVVPHVEMSYKVVLYDLSSIPSNVTSKVSAVDARDPRPWINN